MSNPFSYENKRVVVTGGATGVGAGLLEVLAEQGAEHVTVLDIKTPSGPHSTFLETDLSDRAAVDAAIAAIDGPVHALFNNAGVADTSPPSTVISVNYLALRSLSEGLLDRIPDGGAIVNTASTAGGQWPQRIEMINEVLDLGGDWDADPRLARQPRDRCAVLLLLEGARAGVHDALVAAHDPAWRPHQQRVPVADRHAAAEGLPRDDDRQAHRLEHRAGCRSARSHRARSGSCSRSSAATPPPTSTA